MRKVGCALKRIIALCLLFCLIPLGGANAAEKGGYALTPTMYGKTGVDVSSSFILTAPNDTPLDKIISSISIDGQPAPNVASGGGKEFLITPSAVLLQNSLYIFRLAQEGRDDITWAFQTAKKFQITSSYPYNEATGVAKKSGIEITFSDEGYSPIDSCFSISPAVSGRFEYHKKTAVFVPDALDYQTVYTVTIKAGMMLEGTNERLASDYVFSFETEAEPNYKPAEYPSYVGFGSGYAELPTAPPAQISFHYRYGTASAGVPKIDVYKFSDEAQAISAAEQLTNAPGWSYFARKDSYIDTSRLSRLMSFNAFNESREKSGYYETAELPDRLSQGFYLIEISLDGSRDQMILQINDLPVQVIADNDKAIVWVNDIGTGKASAGAAVHDAKENKTYKTDSDGVAVIDRALAADGGEQLTVTSANGKTCVWFYNSYYKSGTGSSEGYRKVLQLDRTLFKPDDTVSFFGFVQERRNNEEIKNVTAVLTQGYRYGYYSSRDILHRQTVPVTDSVYSDEVRLPNLDSGSYCLTIYHGEIVLGSTHFNVREYTKPPYKMEVTADKKAVFAGDTVTFTANTSFFEGTPVADLDISYNLWGHYLVTGGRGQGKTNSDGEMKAAQEAVPTANTQGQTGLYFTAEATLPEIGQTTKGASVRVFINDIDVDLRAARKDKNAELTVNINSITLDRLNDGSAEHSLDYLDAPVAEKNVATEIFRVYYEKIESGSYYDYIEKKTVPRYSYTRREELITRFDMTTNQDGTAKKSFTVPDRICESYYAKITCRDTTGRQISKTCYIGNDYSDYWQNANSDYYYLDGAEEAYSVGDEVNLTLRRGTDAVTNGNFLFVTMQNGIQSRQAGENPYSFTFAKEYAPNIVVSAYYFNGYNYQSGYCMSKNILFDYSQNDLTLTAISDKESYRPGDMCNIIVTARDKNGSPKKASVNISLVDEALFALQDYSVNTLNSLYRTIGTGLRFEHATHEASSYMLNEGAGAIAAAPEADMSAAASDGEDTYLREVFKDTAFFSTLQTNERGEAVYTFKLPDNITSWRLTISGISRDLYAGNAIKNIIVTNPMFLSYTLNDEFLIGDVPTVGINVYGTDLKGGEAVSFEVRDEAAPDVKYTASGTAFERVNIPLWEMRQEGTNAIIIKASTAGGAGDSLRHEYEVFKTRRELDEACYYDLTADTVFDVGSGGLANITFTDRSRGAFLHQLINMRYAHGDRIEKLIAGREADRILDEYFPDLCLYSGENSFDPKQYQRADGGIAILPHAESDIETTVKLMPYIKDEINTGALKNYLYDTYEGEGSDNKMCALYGLAMLREPVLLDLNSYCLLEELCAKDAAYIALAYCELGESGAASELYDSRIRPQLEEAAPYYRVNTGADNDDILEATSAVSMLASRLDKPEKDGLYQYCLKNHTTDILINVEKLSHIEREIAKRTEASGSITYSLFGEQYERALENGGSYTLRIPAQNMSEFRLLEVTGDVGAVSVYKKPLTELSELDSNITVRRRYYKADESESSYSFEQGDLVRVQVWIDYSAKAVNGSYCVTDYLPSGLEYVSGSAKISGAYSFGYGCYRYCTVRGQQVTFYDYNGFFDKGALYYYYARVISPGAFKAEGPLVQSLSSKASFTVGDDSVVVIGAY